MKKKSTLLQIAASILTVFIGCQIGNAQLCTDPPTALNCGAGIPTALSVEDFEGGIGTFTQSNLDDINWTVQTGPTSTIPTGPSDDACGNGGTYIYVETSFPTTDGQIACVSTTADLTTLVATDPAIASFWYHAYGQCIGDFEVSVNGGASVIQISGEQQTATTDPWIQLAIDLDGLQGTIVNIEFCYTVGTTGVAGCTDIFWGDFAIDQFTVWTCIPPCVLTCEPDVVAPNDPGLCSANISDATIGQPSFVGGCSATLPTNDYTGTTTAAGTYPLGTTTVTWSMLDLLGNTVTCTQDITVVDVEPPVLNCPGNSTIHLDPGDCEAAYSYSTSLTENCAGVPVVISYNSECGNPETIIPTTNSLSCSLGPNHYFQFITVSAPLDMLSVVLAGPTTGGGAVTVNVYDGTGVSTPSNTLPLLATGAGTSIAATYTSIPISGMIPAGVTQVVIEVVTPGEFHLLTEGCGNSSTSWLGAPACTIDPANPVSFTDIGFPLAGLNLTLETTLLSPTEPQQDPLAPAGYNAYESGDYLPIGQHCFQYEATDASGNQGICSWCVDVVEYPNPVTTLSCNANINISLSADCQALVCAGLVLEGGPYGCYDDYNVTISGMPGVALSGNGTSCVSIDASAIPGFADTGMFGPFDVMVTDPETGVSCWNEGWMIEDKLAPSLLCDAVEIACTTDPAPGTTVTGNLSSNLDPADAFAWSDATTGGVGTVNFPISGIPTGGVVTDVNIDLQLDHSWVDDLTIRLTNPEGVSVDLINGSCSDHDNLNVTFDAESSNSLTCIAGGTNFLSETCTGDYANFATLDGVMQPVGDLSDFYNERGNGNWVLEIIDGAGGDGGCLADASISIDYAVYAAEEPQVTENCGTYTLTYEDDETVGMCSDEYANVIKRTWTVTDAKGNTDECVQVINVKFADLADLVFPPNLDNLEEQALTCGDADIDPSNTGEPGGVSCSNIGYTHSDGDTIPLCGNSFKIIRNWTVIDWCTGDIESDQQIITVMDNTAPTISCPANTEASDPGENCEASVTIDGNSIITSDECSSTVGVSASISTGSILQNGADWEASGLPIGLHTVTFTASDACGNTNSCSLDITVTDGVNPVAACETYHTVSLTLNQPTLIAADVFNSGSNDNCGDLTFDVRRLDSCIDYDWTTAGPGIDDEPNGIVDNADKGTGVANSQTVGWYPAVPFSCCDVGVPVTVIFRVTDEAGNRNTCVVTVDVLDEIDAVISCPANVNTVCSMDIMETSDLPLNDISAVDNGGLPAYYYNGTEYEFAGYYADAYDNCSGNVFILDRGGINACGESYFTDSNTQDAFRRYFAAYPGDILVADIPTLWNELTAGADDFCIQLIDVVNPHDFDESDITWPIDVTIDCLADPQATGGPTYSDDACSNVGPAQTPDIIIPMNNDTACYKIIRNWTVYDWCAYDGDGAGEWTHMQTIYVLDTEAPSIETCDVLSLPLDNNCIGNVSLGASGTDNCAGPNGLEWSWEVDTNNDGTVDFSGSGDSHSGTYVGGIHAIIWTLSDGCGNADQCTQLFTVEDLTGPIVLGNSGGFYDLIDQGGGVGSFTLTASDFDNGSFDVCSGICDRRIASPSGGPGQTVPPTTTSVTFDCNTMGNNSLDFWVKDCNNNWSSISTFVVISDPSSACFTPGGLEVAGALTTENGEGVEDVLVNLSGYMGTEMMTSEDGVYTFSGLPVNQNYNVSPTEDLPVLNGISTWDLVLISKHVLQIEALDSPYKIIAADVNSSGYVSTLDLVELRKLILLIETEFPNDDASWRFIPANFVFPDPTDPWVNGSTFPEVVSINDLTVDMEEHFIAIKKGDVNGSAVPNQLLGGDERNATGSLVLDVEDRWLKKGELYTVDFKASDFSEILGYQFSLSFDTDVVEFEGVEEGVLPKLTAANFGLTKLNEGIITTSWNDQVAIDLKDEEVVFSIQFKATAPGLISDAIKISSGFTKAEAYNNDLELLDVVINYQSDESEQASNKFELYQNRPNPFKGETVIGFNLPEASEATLKVYDLSGRALLQINGAYLKGYNEIVVDRSDLNGTGIIYYQLDTETHSVIRKMIVLE